MSAFAIAIFICLLLSILALLRPLLRPTVSPPSGTVTTEAPALQILREQRGEIDAALQDGNLTHEQHAQSIDELALRALGESAGTAPELRTARPHPKLALAAGLFLIAGAGALYLTLGNPAALDPARRAPPPPQITREQIAEMTDKLASRLAAQPNDAEGWIMLGRSYMLLGRFKDASALYARLSTQHPGDVGLLTDWADALANANEGRVSGAPEKLIARALQADPLNVKALALAGTAAFEQNRFTDAIALWEKMATHVDPQSETGQSAQAMIAEARKRAAGENSAETIPAAPVTATGTVEIDPALQGKVHASDVLFIFARPAAGGAPIAALRLTVGDLPAKFDLAKGTLMAGPNATPDTIIIGARISKSGQPMPARGDLQGFTQTLKPDATQVRLVINQEWHP